MDRLKMHSPNLTQDNIARIRELFPGCVTEAKGEDGSVKLGVDFDQLRQELSEVIVEGPQERYHLSWPGKREALLTANAPIAKTLRPCPEESVDFETTKNLFIEGDNLDALKLLQETYLGKIKLIYIDPPYNTGKDFIYDDDFRDDVDNYLRQSNQTDDAGGRLVANTEANGRFHSDWLSMIYARLKLARNLLREDGVIFISIDDNEVDNLRKVCSEVFGEENFVGQVVWQRSKKGDSKLIAKVHEYILCYVRDKAAVLANGVWRRPKEGADQVLAKYAELKASLAGNHEAIRTAMMAWYRQLPETDPRKAHKHYNWSDDRGLYFAADFAGPDDGRESRPRHDILHPVTGKPCKKPSTGWRWDEEKTKWALEQTPPRIHFGPDETTIPTRKSYLFEIDSEPFSSVFYRDGRSATLEVEELVGKGWFQFPKNTDVLAELIELATKPDDIILDFFAGSGSTGHAVLNVNVAHGSKRRYVLVQLAEPTGRTGYATIAEITKQRLRQAGSKIAASLTGVSVDNGFRVLKVDTSNMADVYYAPDALDKANIDLFVDNIKPGRTPEDLLFQVMLDWGVDLALPISKQVIQGKDVFSVDDNALVACFDAHGGVDETLVKELAKRQPLRVVFRDAGFKDSAVKINVEQIFKLLSPATEVKCI
ncbi:adenine-specific DNA-methyltransferase [Burkholderia pseudomallei]|uniref:site-specific DNA-methyltransferase n=1 Tax=Burkholderia pseudomallei TaxID=28450 RepID=UPI00097823CB|nr:site-specific DNA-methyltransferase [Burkholderia pseudomallei]ONF11049.1 DNA methyltransferase [Burkholderia pseudomallei]CAJ6980757.1 adenine-specific DNA-methyltransferase [Burkholderia pseudomallei]CAJ8270671.1 adenine-specific DNA-methyltransferase [Burkholderia pseudomallei]CAJ8331369.1 adenine-specific DNA-methyltransferase [Burkholderia pseudomallei]CAJ8812153.1 adenine-specific DNA-methyltransferase [Burkholderia pseudomallei]